MADLALRLCRHTTYALLVALTATGCSEKQVTASEAVDEPPSMIGARETSSPTVAASARDITVYFRESVPGLTKAARAQDLEAVGVVHASELHGDLPAAVTLPRERLRAFTELPWVEIVEIDSSPPARSLVQPAERLLERSPFATRLAQVVSWGLTDIGALDAHGRQFRGAGVQVAFLDEATIIGHPDLAITGCWDAFGAGALCVYDGHVFDHGTKVAGVLGALDNSSGVLGVAPAASLYGVRVCAPGLGCPDSAVYDGLIWARDHGINVVSISLGTCGGSVSMTMGQLLAQMAASGIFVVVAAGNGVHSVPACNLWDPVSKFASAPGTVAVSAYGTDHLFKPLYQYGPAIDFAGPTDVVTTGPVTTPLPFGGTSAATPHVAAAIAVMLSAGFQQHHILPRLAETTFQPVGEPTPHNNHYGFGQIRLGLAAVGKPSITSVDWCTGGAISTAGPCEFTAHTTGGIAPIQVRFEVTRSDQPGTVHYGWGAPTRTIQVGAGDYTLSVKMFAREGYYLRVGPYSIQEIPVCPSAPALVLESPAGSAATAAANCGGGGGDPN